MTDNELTYQIRGAVWDVYNALGPGLLESVYEEALCFELEQRGLKVERQKLIPLNYKGNALKTDLRLDIIVEDRIIIELKSVEEIKPVHTKLYKIEVSDNIDFAETYSGSDNQSSSLYDN